MSRLLLNVFAAASLILFTAVFARTAFLVGPWLLYRSHRPSIQSECDNIHVGIGLPESTKADSFQRAP